MAVVVVGEEEEEKGEENEVEDMEVANVLDMGEAHHTQNLAIIILDPKGQTRVHIIRAKQRVPHLLLFLVNNCPFLTPHSEQSSPLELLCLLSNPGAGHVLGDGRRLRLEIRIPTARVARKGVGIARGDIANGRLGPTRNWQLRQVAWRAAVGHAAGKIEALRMNVESWHIGSVCRSGVRVGVSCFTSKAI